MRAKIAVLTDEYSEYRKVLVDTIAEENTRQGFGTLCISGRELDPRQENKQDFALGNEIYPIIQQHDIKGIISLSGAVGNNVSVEHLGEFLHQFTLPKVSLGIAVPGLSSVLVNDHAGMTDLMHHLVSETRAKRFSFIRGFESDPYSQQREQIFRQVLGECGIAIDESLIITGNYDSFESYRAVSAMLTRQGDSVDAIVAANDWMALSAARAAAARGYDVPNDIMVTGYDDTKEATKISPALTTVRQPLAKMARLSVELLLEQINLQDKLGTSVDLPVRTVRENPELVVRGSTISVQQESIRADITDRKVLHNQISQSMAGLPAPEHIDFTQITDSLYATLFNNDTSTLAAVLKQQLVNLRQAGQQHWWMNLCHQIEKATRQYVTRPADNYIYASVQAALISVKERCWTFTMDQEFQRQRLESAHTDMQLQISSCSTLQDILTTTEDWLAITRPHRFFLVRYETPGPVPDANAVLMHAFKAGEMSTSVEQEFPTHKLLPDTLRTELQQGLLVLNPVFAGELHFGYLLLDPTGLESGDMTSAALSIGNAMRNHYMIRRLKTQTRSLKQANTELVKLASFDALTGLPNRLYFRQTLEKRFKQYKSSDQDMSILFVDLDGFKFVNDTLGHKAGDDLLIAVADELRSTVSRHTSNTGFVSRLGGDEFTVIVHNGGNSQTIDQLAQDLLTTIATPRSIEGQYVSVSASIGFSTTSQGAKDAESLLHQADSAMYQAKSSGKNKLSSYDAQSERDNDTHQQLTHSLRRAIDDGSLVVHFQPRVDSKTGQIQAAEALMRWIEMTESGPRSVSHPAAFIPVAEASGLIADLDLAALEQCCRQLRLWRAHGIDLPVSVNISVVHLQRQDFVDKILQIIDNHNVPAELIELEITEGAAMTDVENNICKLQQIRQAGVRVAIDDFGTGYSSLAYLKRLPITSLKIDQSFIRDLAENNATNAAIVRTIVALGKTLELRLIAEGIETTSQLAFIQSLDIEEAQGFLFHKPMPASELTHLLMAPTTTTTSRAA